MNKGLKVTVLAGSAEARAIARGCLEQGATVHALVSEPPRGPDPMPVPTTLLDFAAPEGVRAHLADADVVIDASHGFDGQMSQEGGAAAQALGLPVLCYRRPAWPLTDGARAVRDVAEAMAHLGPDARVFSAAGWASLPACAAFPGAVLFLRQTSRHSRAAPYPFVRLSFDQPPFTVDQEIAHFKALRIDTLLCRNLGGQASHPKVAAAAQLGLRALLIDRPALPEGAQVVQSVTAALDWVARQ